MKTQLKLDDFARTIKARAEQKHDFTADTRNLALAPDTGRLVAGSDSYALTDHCHGQIIEHTKIPALYYRRMRDEAPELLSTNVRAWFDKYPARRMVRTLGDTARAFLSDKYGRMDDDAFVDVVMPAIIDVPGFEIVSTGITDLKTHIKFKSPRKAREVKKGDEVQFGVAYSNSEVGAGRLTGSLFAYRLVCLNGMIIEDEAFAATHVGKRVGGRELGEIFALDTNTADAQATILKLRDFTKHILDDNFIDDQVDRMRGLTKGKIAKPAEAIEVLAKRHSFTEGQSNDVLKYLIEGGDLSTWGLANAVTRAAEDQEDYNEATRLETLGGRMLRLTPSEHHELLAAA